MSFLNNIRNSGNNTPPMGSNNFVIYTEDILQDPSYVNAINIENFDESQVADETVAAAFQGINNFGMKYQTNIAFEPLENGEFSNDSIGGTPFEIGIVAEVAPIFSDTVTNDQKRREYIGEVEDMLIDALSNKKQLVLLQTSPLFKLYTNIKITELSYDISVDHLNMVAFMKFQQIRITNTEYDYVPATNVNGAHNASTRQNGYSQPQPVSSDIKGLL